MTLPRSISRVSRLVAAALLGVGVFAVSAGRTETPSAEALGPNVTTITFYGQQFEASDFVFCLDTSASMGWDGLAAVQLAETVSALSQLTPSQSFAVVTHSPTAQVFSPTLLPATPANVLAAQNFLSGITPSGASCPLSGLLETPPLAAQSADQPVIIFTATGPSSCNSASAIATAWAAANSIGASLVTVSATFGASPGLFEFLSLLQLANDQAAGGLEFVRGDANGDGIVNIADPIFILQDGFGLICVPYCKAAADANGDSALEPISDAVTLIGALFVSGSPPILPPFPSCGSEAENRLSCIGGSCP